MANTFSSSLVVDTGTRAAVTVLQNRLAPLNALSTDFSSDVVDPLRKLQVGVATASAAAVSNPTSFAVAGSTLSNAAITMTHISAGFGLTSQQLNQGFRLEKLMKIALRKLADAVMDNVLTPIGAGTVGSPTFGTAYTSAITTSNALPGNTFISAALGTIWASISNSSSKALILDGSYYQYLLPQTGFNLDVAQKGAYGFENGIYLNNRWTGVTGGTDNGLNGTTRTIKGLVASEEAMAVATAIPYIDPAVASLLQLSEVIEIPDLGVAVNLNIWADQSTRSLYGSYDLAVGSAVADTSAMKTISA
jgi:hypothetical protein